MDPWRVLYVLAVLAIGLLVWGVAFVASQVLYLVFPRGALLFLICATAGLVASVALLLRPRKALPRPSVTP